MKILPGKIPLKYQSTEYDCVPTTFLNAINYLFDRNEIQPEVIQRILLYSLDTINRNGVHGKGGTTGLSCEFILEWLHRYYKNELECEYILGNEVHLGQNNKIVRCVNEGGVALCSVINKTGSMNHYMLCTEEDCNFLYFFDPWFRQQQFRGTDSDYLEWVTGEWNYNLKVSRHRLDVDISEKYSFGQIEDREVCLMKRVSK